MVLPASRENPGFPPLARRLKYLLTSEHRSKGSVTGEYHEVQCFRSGSHRLRRSVRRCRLRVGRYFRYRGSGFRDEPASRRVGHLDGRAGLRAKRGSGKMHHWQNLGAAIMLVSASIGAQAAEQNWTVEGSSLKIGRSCASTVDIQPNGAGHQVTVAASADKDEEIKKLHVTGGDIASIDVNGFDCYKPGW